MKLKSVFVRGVGAYTPFASTWSESVPFLADGKSAIGPVESFDCHSFPCRVAASVRKSFDDIQDRRIAFAKPAAQEAWKSAQVSADPARIGVFIGAESGRATFQTVLALAQAAGGKQTFDHRQFGIQARKLAPHIDASVASPAAVASTLAREYGALGPVETISLACSSSSSAIAEGARAIRLGEVDVALCGGVGTDIDPLMLAGFGLLSALSSAGISRPFDLGRDGFVVGEGAAMVVLASEKGNAQVEVLGEGRSLDAHHLTAPDPQGLGAERSMKAALKAADIDSVDYIQAHGTSTPLNDEIEAKAIRKVFNSTLHQTHVSSVKGAFGHWVAGAGAIGFLCAVETLSTGKILPTAGLTRPDPNCDLPHVMNKAIQRQVETALVNAFAFGGANCSLVLGRCA